MIWVGVVDLPWVSIDNETNQSMVRGGLLLKSWHGPLIEGVMDVGDPMEAQDLIISDDPLSQNSTVVRVKYFRWALWVCFSCFIATFSWSVFTKCFLLTVQFFLGLKGLVGSQSLQLVVCYPQEDVTSDQRGLKDVCNNISHMSLDNIVRDNAHSSSGRMPTVGLEHNSIGLLNSLAHKVSKPWQLGFDPFAGTFRRPRLL